MSTPTVAPPNERLVSTLARDWACEIAIPKTSTVTGTASETTDRVTVTGTTLAEGDQVRVISGGAAVGLTDGTTYTVDDPQAGAFQLITTTGATVNLSAAGDVQLQVETYTWQLVRAMKSFKATDDPNFEDDSDYDGGGFKSQAKTETGWKIELRLGRKISRKTGRYPVEQDYLEQQAQLFTPDDEVRVRWYQRSGRGQGRMGWASPSWSLDGDKTGDLADASVELQGQGAYELIANPNAA